MASQAIRRIFNRSQPRRRKLLKPTGPSLRSRLGGGLCVAEPLESRAMLAITPTFAVGTLTLDYANGSNEAIVELYSWIDSSTPANTEYVDAFFLDVTTGTSKTFSKITDLVVTESKVGTDDILSLQTTQGKTSFQIIGNDVTSTTAGIWEGETKGFIGLNISQNVETLRVRTPSTASVSGKFKLADNVVEVTAATINAGDNFSTSLEAATISLQATQVNVGNLGVNATNALTLTSTGALTVTSVAGDLKAKTSLTVTAASNISLGPAIDLVTAGAGGTITVTSTGGAMSIGGAIKSGGNVSLQAQTGTTVVGAISSAIGSIAVVDLGNVVLGGGLESTTKAVAITSQTGLIDVVGGVKAATGITLTAGTTIKALSLETTAVGPITTTSGGATTIVGTTKTVNSPATIAAGGAVSLGGAVNLGTAALTLSGAGVTLDVPADVTAGKVTVNSTDTTTFGGKLTASSAVAITSSGAVSLAGIQAADSLSVTSQKGSITSSAAATITTTAVLDAADVLTVSGSLKAGDIDAKAVNAVTISGDATATSTNLKLTSAAAGVTVNGTTKAAAGNVTISAGTAATLTGTVAGIDIAVAGVQSVSAAGPITASGTIALTSASGSVSTGGAVTGTGAGKAVTVAAATNASLGGGITTSNGAIASTASTGSLSLSGAIDAGSGAVSLTGGGGITATVASTITANKITATSGGVASFGGALTAANLGIAATAAGNLTLSGGATTTSAGGISLASTGGSTTVSGSLTSKDTVTLDSKFSSVDVTGTITAVNGVTASAIDKVRAAGEITSTAGGVSLTSSTSSVTAGGIKALAGGVAIQALDTTNGSVTTGQLTANSVTVDAGKDATVVGNIDTSASNGDVTLNAKTGALQVAGTITAGTGTVAVTSGTNLSAGTASGVTAGTFTSKAGGTTLLNGPLTVTNDITVVGTGKVDINGAVESTAKNIALTSQSSDLTVGGSIKADQALATSAGGKTSITGSLTGNKVSVTSVGDLTVTGATKSTGATVDLISNTGNILVAGIDAFTKLKVLATTGNITVTSLDADDTMTVTASAGNVTLSGPVTTSNDSVDISAGGTATFNATASVTAGTGNVNVTATGDVTTAAGATLAGNAVKVQSGANATLNGATAGATLDVIATKVATLNGTSSAANAVTVSGITGVNVNGPLSSTNATIDVTSATGPVQAVGTLTAPGTISVTASLDNATTAAISSATGTINIKAGKTASLTGALAAPGSSLTVKAETVSSLATSTLDAASILLRASGAMTLNAEAKATGPGGIDAAGALATAVNAPLTATTGPVSIASLSNALTVNGPIAASVGSVLASGVTSATVNGPITSGGATSLTASAGPLSVSGKVNAGGTLSASSSGAATFGNNISANRVDVTSTGDSLTVGGLVTSATTVDLSAAAGLTTGSISSTGATTIQAGTSKSGDIAIAGSIITNGGNLAVQAGSSPVNTAGSVSVAAPVNTAGGKVDITAIGTGKSLSVTSISAGAGAVTLSGDTVNTAAGTTVSGGAIAVNANAAANISGGLTSTGAIGISSSSTGTAAMLADVLGKSISVNSGVVTVTGSVTTTAGNASLAANSADLTVTKAVTASGNIDLLALKNVTTVGLAAITPTGTITVTSGQAPSTTGNISLAGAVSTIGGKIQLNAGSSVPTNALGSISVTGPITSATGSLEATAVGANQGVTVVSVNVGTGNVTLSGSGGGDVTLATGGAISGKNVSFNADDAIVVGGVVTATSALQAAGGSVTFAADVSGGSVSGIATAGSLVAAATVIATAGSVSLQAAQAVGLSKAVSGTNAVDILAQGGVSLLGPVTATTGRVSVGSLGSISVSNPITAGAQIELQAATSISSSIALTSGTFAGAVNKNIQIIASGTDKATGSVALGGNVTTTGGDLLVSAGINPNPTSPAGTIAIGSFVTTAGGNVLLQAGTPGTSSTISIAGIIDSRGAVVDGIVGAISDTFSLAAGGSIFGGFVSLTANDTATINGDVIGSAGVQITGTNTVAVNKTIGSGGSLTLSSAAAAISITDDISAVGPLTVSGGTTVDVNGALLSGDAITVTGIQAVNIFDSVTALGAATISSGKATVFLTNAIRAGGLLSVTANGSVTAGANAPLTSTGDSVRVVSSTASLTLGDSVSAQDDVTLVGDTAVVLSANSPVTAQTGDIAVRSNTNAVTLGRSLAAGGRIDVTANTAIFTATAAPLTAGGDVLLGSATSTITLNARVSAAADLTASASGLVVTSAAAPLVAGADLLVTSDTATVTLGNSATAGGSLALNAAGAVKTSTISPLNAGTTIVVSSDTSTIGINALITAGGAVSLLGELAVTTSLDSAITAGGSLTVTSDASSVTIGDTATAAGNIVIRGQTTVSHLSTAPVTSTGGSLSITANTGAVTLANDSPLSADTTLKIAATGAGGSFTSGNGSDLTSTNGGVTVTTNNAILLGVDSGVKAGQSITLRANTAAGSITTSTGASLGAGAGVSVKSDLGKISIGPSAIIKAVNNVDLTAQGGITTAADADITAGGDTFLKSNAGAITVGGQLNAGGTIVSVRALGGNITTTNVKATINGNAKVFLEASDAIQLGAEVSTTDLAAGLVTLQANNGINQESIATITTGALTAVNNGPGATGNITLIAPLNTLGDVNPGIFAAANSVSGGTITLFHTGNLEIGVGQLKTSGITTTKGDIAIQQNGVGDILITQPIVTGKTAGVDTANVLLESFGQIADSNNGRILATSLTARNFGGTGSIVLDSTTNDVVNLALRNLATGEKITFNDATAFTIGVAGEGVRSDLGDITLTAGTLLTAAAEIYAGQTTQTLPTTVGTTITLAATTGITQNTKVAGEVVGNNLVMRNTTGEISLQSTTNDVEQLAAVNIGGAISYTDVSDFETGVVRSNTGLPPVGYEINTPGVLTLQAGAGGGVGSPSTLRVVSGLRYGSLSLRAGDSKTGSVGTVEYVTTSDGDNTRPGPQGGFAGTLRDMITYSNANKARQTVNGVSRVQPQLAVFDEEFYTVEDITLASALPTIVQPLSIDGTRVENTVLNPRVGIDGSKITVTSVVNGLTYGAGSSDSAITGLALYGFKTGAGISLVSGVNTITNTYAGLQRDGTADATKRNLVGIELNGRLSTKNIVGTVITDDVLANVVGNNVFAGISLRDGASSNAVVGNYIGTDQSGADVGNLGDGVRIDRSISNTIGTPTSQRPDLTAAQSNSIRFNGGSGVRITSASAATRAQGNFIQNNLIDSNDFHGIHIVSSTQQTVGGALLNESNVITNHTAAAGAGIYMQSSNGNQVTANLIGVETTLGNGGNSVGIRLQASSNNIIDSGNQVSFNLGNGIELLQGSNGNRIEGNYIGSTIDENTDLAAAGNLGSGIVIQQSLSNLVQGGNLIANNALNGLSIIDAEARDVRQGNVILANTVTANGGLLGVVPPTAAGILVQGGGFHTIGSLTQGNSISLTNGDGIRLENGSLTGDTVSNLITGNFVGTNQFDEDLLGNARYGIIVSYGGRNTIAANHVLNNGVADAALNDAFDGIKIAGSSNNVIGSTALGSGNIVSANGRAGIVVTDAVDVAGFGTVEVVGTVASFSRSQAGKLRVNDRIVINNDVYTIIRVETGTRFQVTAGPAQPAGSPFFIRTPVANTGNVVVGNAVANNVANGIEVSGTKTNLVTVGQISVPGRAVEGAPNVISGNDGYGIAIDGTSGVTFQGNRLFGNGSVDPVTGLPVAGGGISLVNNANQGSVVPTLLAASVASTSNGVYSVTVQGTVAATGAGTATANKGVATFSVAQTLAVNDWVVVQDKAYRVSAVTNPTRVTLAGSPTFAATDFRILRANQINQQYVVDLYLNDPWEGDSGQGANYQGQVFLGRTSVTINSGNTGAFTATSSYASSDTPLGMFVTGTTTTSRAATGVIRYSTSGFSAAAVEVTMPPVGPAASAGVFAKAAAVAAAQQAQGSGSTQGSTTSKAKNTAFAQLVN